MYGSVPNQFYHLLHFGLSLTLIYLLIPRYLFNTVRGTATDRNLSYFMRMNLLVICLGYVLVISKLYEAIGISICVIVFVLVRKSRHVNPAEDPATVMMARFYDLLEFRHVLTSALGRLRLWSREVMTHTRPGGFRISITRLIPFLLATIVILIASYVRGIDSLLDPAPALSDGYVTLAWMKYVNERILFHDGIYPQGMYFAMATLGKFAFINLLYILRYMGPMNTILIVWGLYYVISALSGSRMGGTMAAAVYGVFGVWLLQGDWTRQAATNSQEFGLLFVVPTMYYLYRYLHQGQRSDYWTAVSGLCVTGLSHPLAYALAVIAFASVMTASVILHLQDHWKRLIRSVYGGFLSGAVALAPIGAGLALGHKLNSSSQSFATSTVQTGVPFPTLHWADWLALLAVIILLTGTVIELTRGRKRAEWLLSAVFGLGVFALYFAGGPLTHSQVLVSRALDLWAVALPFTIGMAWAAAFYLLPSLPLRRWIEIALAVGIIGTGMALSPPHPISTYKMQWSQDVQQYLSIDDTYRYTGYMIVAPEEEYALVLGTGYRMSIADFVTMFNPAMPPLTRYGDHSPYRKIAADVFVYFPKHIYQLPATNSVYPLEAPIYRKRLGDRQALSQWLTTYRTHHRSLDIYFEDPNLIVYHFHIQPPKSTNP